MHTRSLLRLVESHSLIWAPHGTDRGVHAHHQGLGRHCRSQFPFCGYRALGLNPGFTKESPANVVKAAKALLTAESLETLWVGPTPEGVPRAGGLCPRYRGALPVYDASPRYVGLSGKDTRQTRDEGQGSLGQRSSPGEGHLHSPLHPHTCVLLTVLYFLLQCLGLWPHALHVDMCPLALAVSCSAV